MLRPQRGSSQPQNRCSGGAPQRHHLYAAAAFPPLPLGCCSTPPPHLVFLPPGTRRAFIFPGSAWMTKPVDYLFFFTRHPPASRELPHRGGIWGLHPRCRFPVLTLFPNRRLSLKTPLILAGKNQVGLKIPCLFALCFFWCLQIVFKRFPTKVGVRNTSLSGEPPTPSLTCCRWPRFGRKTRLVLGAQGWWVGKLGRPREGSVKRLPVACPLSLQVGTGGHGGRWSVGGSWGKLGAG